MCALNVRGRKKWTRNKEEMTKTVTSKREGINQKYIYIYILLTKERLGELRTKRRQISLLKNDGDRAENGTWTD